MLLPVCFSFLKKSGDSTNNAQQLRRHCCDNPMSRSLSHGQFWKLNGINWALTAIFQFKSLAFLLAKSLLTIAKNDQVYSAVICHCQWAKKMEFASNNYVTFLTYGRKRKWKQKQRSKWTNRQTPILQRLNLCGVEKLPFPYVFNFYSFIKSNNRCPSWPNRAQTKKTIFSISSLFLSLFIFFVRQPNTCWPLLDWEFKCENFTFSIWNNWCQ